MNMIRLISKNLKILFRSKLTAFVLIFGPLLIILLTGLAFNNSLSYNIKIGVYSSEYSELSDAFVNNMEQDFSVTKFVDEAMCVDSIKSKGYHACVVIPPNLQIEEGSKNLLDVYFDNSRVNIASSIKESIFSSIDETSTNISQGYTENLIQSLVLVESEVGASRAKIENSISKLNENIRLTQSSDSLLKKNKFDLDLGNINLNELKIETKLLKDDFSTAKDIAGDGIDLLDEIYSLSNVTGYDSDISDLENRLSNVSSNTSADASFVYSKVSALVDEVKSVQGELDEAKENNKKVSSNLNSLKEESVSTVNSLSQVKSSSDKILKSVGLNSVRDATSISSPVELQEFEIVTGSKLNFMFPNLIILVIMFVTVISSATQVINEKLNKAKTRMQMTPSPFLTNALATFFTILMIAAIQLILVLLLTQFFFGINLVSSLFSIIIVLLFAVVFFTLLGISIGFIFNTEHTVMLGSITVSSFFFILSDLILPLESMPEKLISIMNYTPFVLSTDLLRKVMFFSIDISSLKIPFYSFIGYSVLMLFLIFIVTYIHRLGKYWKARKRSKLALKNK